MKKSFYDWCLENNHQDVLDRWDYELNKCNPNDIGCSTHKQFYLKCPRQLHQSELCSIGLLCNGKQINFNCHKCYSFAQHLKDLYGETALDLYWDYNKNNLNPWNLKRSCHQKVWIYCQDKDYHKSYEIACNTFVNMHCKCPYCGGKKVHKLDSLGYLYPEILNVWSDKNEKSPYEYSPYSMKKVWWKCPNGKHEDYIRNVVNSNIYNFRCHECVRERLESFLQEKVRMYITEIYKFKLNHEYGCTLVPINIKTKNPLPFDNEIIDLKLIIEVHGIQHYKKDCFTSSWRDSQISSEQQLHKRQLYDRYKKYIAYINGYHYLEIPYWTDDKNETYKKLIDKKIEEILNIDTVCNL